MERHKIVEWLTDQINKEYLLCELSDITEGFITNFQELIDDKRNQKLQGYFDLQYPPKDMD